MRRIPRYGLFGAIVLLLAVGIAVVVDRSGDDGVESASTGDTTATTVVDRPAGDEPGSDTPLGGPITVPGAATTRAPAPATTASTTAPEQAVTPATAPAATAPAATAPAAPAAPEQAQAPTTTPSTTATAPEGMPNTGGPALGPAGLVLVILGLLLWRASRAGRHRPPAA